METALLVSSIFLWLVILFNLLLTLGLIRQQGSSGRRSSNPFDSLPVGQPAPEFTAQTLDEKVATLSTYAGRQVALIFISVGCAPCRDLLPTLESLYPHMRNANAELALVSGNSLEATRAYVQEQQITLPMLVAPRGSNPFFDTYKATLTPCYYLIDEKGNIQSAGLPGLEGGEWERLTAGWRNREAQKVGRRR